MAQIFVSHSARDVDLVNYFSRLAARTKVRLVFEELEKLISGTVNSETIRGEITSSKALFLLLSKHVQSIPHTRDWVVWEAGVGNNKDIWVFEKFSDAGQVSVVTPFIRNYVVFEPTDANFAYLSAVVESYDDSHVLPTMLTTTGLGAVLGEGLGAALGVLAGAAMSDKSASRPRGVQLQCAGCSSSYSAHLPRGITRFRCPVCNVTLTLPSAA